MSYIPVDSKFKLRLLALSVSLSFWSPVFAMQAIDDEALADSTGEGIAFLPENFSLLFQGANAVNPTAADLNDRTKDTGYIRYIPVGPLTAEAQSAGAGKADLYLYGLAISQSAQNYGANRTSADWNNRFSRAINSWGSAINPWVFKVQTENNVPNFSALTPSDTGSGSVSYLALEAPRFNADTDGNLTDGINSGINALSTAEKSAYNLKLGLWADALVRNPNVAENLTATGTQFDVGGAGRANRLRLQGVWDGLSLNGTQLQIFQTLGGATNTGGMSTFYNNTLGIAGLLRFNSGDGQTLRATSSLASSIAGQFTRKIDPWSLVWNGETCGAATSSNYTNGGCKTQEQTRLISDPLVTSTWTVPSALKSVLRLSTQESTDTNVLNTPAIVAGSPAPTFNSNEGVYIYNANINLVLGSLYQPLTVGVAPDGKNLTLEIARIPNKSSIYTKVYTRYAGDTGDSGVTYTGSTCNIYQCGNNGATGYQGTNATHSSITIGSTSYNASTNTITAYNGIESVGISFGALTSNTVTSGSAASYREVQNRTRTGNESCGWGCTYSWGSWGSWANINQTTYSPTVYTRNPALPAAIPAAPSFPTAQSSVPSNNFGSAAIDGLLIQHMKITTKGL